MAFPKRLFPLVLALLVVWPIACQDAQPRRPGAGNDEQGQPEHANPNIRFGMPAPASADPKNREAFLIERPQYVLSYNDRTRGPNWVSWRLEKSNIGKAKRGAFQADPLLPPGFHKVTAHTEDGSGFDRGHQCPAQDRSSSQEDMDATFYTTNIVPQAPHCNQHGWERLEAYCRELTHDGHVLWIACGPAGVGGEGTHGRKDEIGKGVAVTVPAKLWKVILVLPHADSKPTRASRTIAVIFPNDQSVDYDWAKYRCSVAEVEKLAGCKFWPTLPADLARDLKAKADDVKVHVPEHKKDTE